MVKITKLIILITLVAFLGFGLIGCGQDEPQQTVPPVDETEDRTGDTLDEGADTTFDQEPVDRFGDRPGEGEAPGERTGEGFDDTHDQRFEDRPGERTNDTPGGTTPGTTPGGQR
jgi:hypothetical protein